MSLSEIQAEISKLTAHERRQLLQELAEAEADAWDRQIAEDAKEGRLDHLIAEADEAIRAGRVAEMP